MADQHEQEITEALAALSHGAPEAMDRLMPLVYRELKRIAHRQLGAESHGHFRMQRALDFDLTGQRLGDLRRYAAAGMDLFPTGKVGSESCGSMHCFIVPQSEKSGNPNY